MPEREDVTAQPGLDMSRTGPWRELDEDDLLYCVVFSGEGQPHTNEPYCQTMPYRHRMFYGDGTFALAYNALLTCLGRTTADTTLEFADARYTARLFVGDRIRIRYDLSDVERAPAPAAPPEPPPDGRLGVHVEVDNQRGEVALVLDVVLRDRVEADENRAGGQPEARDA